MRKILFSFLSVRWSHCRGEPVALRHSATYTQTRPQQPQHFEETFRPIRRKNCAAGEKVWSTSVILH
jgi:hypothetical protein